MRGRESPLKKLCFKKEHFLSSTDASSVNFKSCRNVKDGSLIYRQIGHGSLMSTIASDNPISMRSSTLD